MLRATMTSLALVASVASSAAVATDGYLYLKCVATPAKATLGGSDVFEINDKSTIFRYMNHTIRIGSNSVRVWDAENGDWGFEQCMTPDKEYGDVDCTTDRTTYKIVQVSGGGFTIYRNTGIISETMPWTSGPQTYKGTCEPTTEPVKPARRF